MLAAGGREHIRDFPSRWGDVADGAEHVVRIPPRLHAREALVVGSEGGAHAIRALVADEVQVGAAGAVRREDLAGAVAEGDDPLVVGRVVPQQERVDDVARLALGQRSAVRGHARHGAAPGGDEDLRRPGRQLLRQRCDRLDRGVAEVVEVLGGPPAAVARRVVDRALEVGVADWAERVERGRPVLADRRERVLGRFDRAGVHAGDRDRPATAQLRGDALLVGGVEVDERERQLVGRVVHDIAEQAQQFAPALGRVHHEAAEDLGPDRVQRELDRGDDAEVAAAAAQRPEQLGMLVGGRADLVAAGGDELDGEDVVAREAVLALEPAGAAAEREARHAGAGDAAADGREAVRLRGGVELGPRQAGARPHDAALRIDADRAQAADVDDDSIVDEREPGDRVAAAAHGDAEVAQARVVERGGDVTGVRAADDVAGATLDAGVEERAGLVVFRLARVVHVAPQLMAELVKGAVLND